MVDAPSTTDWITAVASLVSVWLTYAIWTVMKRQNDIISTQTEIQKEQTSIFKEQTTIQKIQTEMFNRQTGIVENQIKLEFINKRLEMYNDIAALVNRICNLEMDTYSAFEQHRIIELEADFSHGQVIFQQSIWLYISEIQTKANELVECFAITISYDLRDKSDKMRVKPNLISKAKENWKWFNEQSPILFEHFKPDLDISHLYLAK